MAYVLWKTSQYERWENDQIYLYRKYLEMSLVTDLNDLQIYYQ